MRKIETIDTNIITVICDQCRKEKIFEDESVAFHPPNWLDLGLVSLQGGDGDGCYCLIDEKGEFCSLDCAIKWLKERCGTT